MENVSFSLRNPRSHQYTRFRALRAAAVHAMDGRCWSAGPIGLSLKIVAPEPEIGRHRVDYLGGVMDTLDGSHGLTFTYLPVVYEDDRQVVRVTTSIELGDSPHYSVRLDFLGPDDLIAPLAEMPGESTA